MVSRIIPDEAKGLAASRPIPSPTLGLNTRDHFTNLQPNEAREMINWIPDVGSCSGRPGYSLWCDIEPPDGVMVDELGQYWVDELGAYMSTLSASATTLNAHPVGTLARHLSGASQKMIAACNGKLFEVMGGASVQLATGYTNNVWSTQYFNGYLFGVNGVDTPWRYNGTAVVATGWTGPTLANLRTVNLVGERLWFSSDNTGDVYYGGSMLITGALTLFAASQIADGGKCLGVFPWRDNTVMCYDTGQVLIYSGDPATTFSLVSKYYAPPLVAYDAAVEMGSELILMTTAGPISMEIVAAGLGFNLDALGNWGKIAPSWEKDCQLYGGNAGWFGKFINGLVYFNVPNGTNPSKQYIFNTRNQAWTTFNDLPIASMEVINGDIYIGSCIESKVFNHSGNLDDHNHIILTARPGYNYFDNAPNNKMFSRIKPNIFTDGNVLAQVGIDVDFVDSPFNGEIYDIGAASSGTPWGSPWGSPWGTLSTSDPRWIGVAGKGRAASPIVKLYSRAKTVKWFSTDVLGRLMGPT